MTVQPLIIIPDAILRQTAKPVESFGKATDLLFDNMLETMYDASGIGLAAVQIGVLERVIVMDVAEREGEAPNPIFMANPIIVWESDAVSEFEEGCLSIPNFKEMVTRPAEVKLIYQDRKGNPHNLHAKDLLAVCVQHEIDHLNGVLFIDHIARLKRDRIIKKFTKAKRLGVT